MRHGAALCLSLLLLSPATANAQQRQAPPGVVSLSSFFDRPVVSSDGTQLGLTKHVAINVEDGDAPFLAVGSGAVLSLVPLAALSGGANGAPFRLAMSSADFARAPQWPADRLAAINRPAFIGALSDRYRRPVTFSPAAVAAVGEGTPLRFIGVAPPGVQVENLAGRVRLWGDQVALASGGKAGSISDLLLDLRASKVVEAAVDMPDRRVAMPFPALDWAQNRQAFVSSLTGTQLAGLAAAEWSRRPVTQMAEVPPAPERRAPELMFNFPAPGPRFW